MIANQIYKKQGIELILILSPVHRRCLLFFLHYIIVMCTTQENVFSICYLPQEISLFLYYF